MKPMLAMDYKKRGHNIKWPAYIQPKLNGIRCLATMNKHGNIVFTSREENEFPAVKHLASVLKGLMAIGDVWDGELFTKALTFQEICSAVKREQPNTNKIEYWVYDCVRPETFEDRHLHIDSRIKNGSGLIIPVTTLLVDCEADMLACHKTMMDAGYEGTIIRNRDGMYVHKRSSSLQKHKTMVDAEYKIIGGKEGSGKFKGMVIFKCYGPDINRTTGPLKGDKTFDVVPKGTFAEKEQMLKDLPKLIGNMLTVQYQTLSDEGVPMFPVGITVRDYE